jgi:hypothetical protein
VHAVAERTALAESEAAVAVEAAAARTRGPGEIRPRLAESELPNVPPRPPLSGKGF